MEVLTIEKKNDVYMKVNCDPGVAMELSDYFTFMVPGAKHMHLYKIKKWDGKIRLFQAMSRQTYCGLLQHVIQFAKERNYTIEYADSRDFDDTEFSIVEAKEFARDIQLKLEPRDYQLEAFVYAVRKRRALLLSPTASGKSLVIYLLSQMYRNEKVLIIVPTTSLVHQMTSDFISYGGSAEDIHKIYAGQDKNSECPFIITTWQSIYQLDKDWFQQFKCIIGDEAHLFKAKSLTSILEKTINCPYKFGFTGTLDGTETHKLVLEGLFGSVKKVTTTSELIDQKHLSEFFIKAIVLKHSDEKCELLKKADYQQEIDYLVNNKQRNKFIMNLALSLEGNTLILYQLVEKHGEILFDMIKNKGVNNDVYFVYGGVDGEERERIRNLVETKNNAIIVASYRTFSTGVNLRNLHNIVFASPSKSRIRNLQSIGRGLRKSDGKEKATLYDIADDLRYKSKTNFTLLHFIERIKVYGEEHFPYKIYNVKLKE